MTKEVKHYTVKYIDGEPIYKIKQIELAPEFPGGKKEMRNYLSANIVYPKKARKKGIEGKVIIEFVVNKKGEIINEAVFKGINSLLDNEALRVVKEMPRWKAGKQDGKKINVKMLLPVNFIL